MGRTNETKAMLVVNTHNFFQENPTNCYLNRLERIVDSDPTLRSIPSNETKYILTRKDITFDDLRPYTTRLEKYFIIIEDSNMNYPPIECLLLEVVTQIPGRNDYDNPLSLAEDILQGTARFVPNKPEKNDCKIYTELMRRAMSSLCIARQQWNNVKMYKQDCIRIDDACKKVRVIGTERFRRISPFDPYRNKHLSPILNPRTARAILKHEVKF